MKKTQCQVCNIVSYGLDLTKYQSSKMKLNSNMTKKLQ